MAVWKQSIVAFETGATVRMPVKELDPKTESHFVCHPRCTSFEIMNRTETTMLTKGTTNHTAAPILNDGHVSDMAAMAVLLGTHLNNGETSEISLTIDTTNMGRTAAVTKKEATSITINAPPITTSSTGTKVLNRSICKTMPCFSKLSM